MLKRIRLLRTAGATLAALALVTAAPAQADVMDCIKVVAPPEVAQAVEDAANAAQCVGQAASGDAAMIATIGVITALRAGGAFSNTEQCMGMIDSTIGKQVAKAVLASPAASAFEPVKSELQAMADGNSSVSFTDLVSKFEKQQSCCAPGQVMKPVGWKDKVDCNPTQTVIGGQCTNVEKATAQCGPACVAPKYFDTVTGQCTSCKFDSVPVYASANSSMTGTHVVFSGVSGASFSVTAKPVSGTNSRYRAPVNGIQIVWPSGS